MVEDIIDSGLTMSQVLPWLKSLGAASVKLAALLVKREAMKVDVQIDYIGFEIKSLFVIGYGKFFLNH